MEQEDDDYENDEDYDEENYEDEENDEEKENDFIPEFNAKDRTGKYNYDDKFVSNEDHIIKVIHLLIDKLGLDEDVNYIISNINNISNIKYKNPYGIVFGYLITKQSKIIDTEKFKKIIKKFNTFKKESEYEIFVTEPDLLRYARLWENINKNK